MEPKHGPYLDRLADDFRGWSHVDHFCGDMLRLLLDSQPKMVMQLVDEWNVSSNRWKRWASGQLSKLASEKVAVD